MDEKLSEAKRFLFLLQKGEHCWCEVGHDNPMMKGQHTTLCIRLSKFMEGYSP